MRGYLLDNQHVDALFRKVPSVVAKYDSVPPDWFVWICTITLGEIEAGHLLANPPDAQKQDDYNRFLNEEFIGRKLILPVSEFTRIDYAELLARVWHAHPPASDKVKTEVHLVKNLGVDINDLWLVSIAREHNLICVTDDKMTAIKAAAFDVEFENWLRP